MRWPIYSETAPPCGYSRYYSLNDTSPEKTEDRGCFMPHNVRFSLLQDEFGVMSEAAAEDNVQIKFSCFSQLFYCRKYNVVRNKAGG